MNAAWAGWALAVVAVAVGYTSYGWQGVALAVTVIVFWLLLEFSRSLRALREAAGRPVGMVPNAVMLNAQLKRGMHLTRVFRLTRSLGHKLPGQAEGYRWADGAGDEVHVMLDNGRVARWELRRSGA
jgi:hypothetical protein